MAKSSKRRKWPWGALAALVIAGVAYWLDLGPVFSLFNRSPSMNNSPGGVLQQMNDSPGGVQVGRLEVNTEQRIKGEVYDKLVAALRTLQPPFCEILVIATGANDALVGDMRQAMIDAGCRRAVPAFTQMDFEGVHITADVDVPDVVPNAYADALKAADIPYRLTQSTIGTPGQRRFDKPVTIVVGRKPRGQ